MKPKSGILKVSKPLDCSMIPRKGSFLALVKALAVFLIIKLTNHRQKEIAHHRLNQIEQQHKMRQLAETVQESNPRSAFPAGNSLTIVTSLN